MSIVRNTINNAGQAIILSTLALMALCIGSVNAQESAETQQALQQPAQAEQDQLLDSLALQELVGPIALYPDDLVAIVLPAATYPLQIVQAARFLDALEQDPELQPDEDWDDSVVAMLNYPEAVRLLNDDLDWTLQLGDAVLNQQDDVVAAIAEFRDRAYLAGNLKSDDKQSVVVEQGAIEIAPADPQVIYVPYYEPARVVVVQQTPVYYYYPDPYPLYYYPYPAHFSFSSGFFWGVTTAFSIGWHSHHVQVHYPYYSSHRYYNHVYYPRHYVRHHTSRKHRNDTHGSGFAGDYRDNRDHQDGRRNEGDNWQAGHRTSARPVRWANRINQPRDQVRVANRNRSGEQISVSYRKTLAEDRSERRISVDEEGASRTAIGRTTNWKGNSQAASGNLARAAVKTNHDPDIGKKQRRVDMGATNKASRVTVVSPDRRRESPGSRPTTKRSAVNSQSVSRKPVTVANATQRDSSTIGSRNRSARARPDNRSVAAGEPQRTQKTRKVSASQARPSALQSPQVSSPPRQSAATGSAIVQTRSVQQQAPRRVIASAPVKAPVSEAKPVAKANKASQPVYSSGGNSKQRSTRNSARSRQ